MFVISRQTRSEASAICTEAALGNGLVAIPTELHHAYIVSQIAMQPELRVNSSTSYNDYWTSGENVIDGVWTWSTTLQPFNYTKFWPEHNPSTGYVSLYDNRNINPSPYYDWDSRLSPETSQRSICQHFVLSS
ncbi:unnamed protein product [Owenia fusiformis]|uniref:C-type lectin domain-containing protein n=1 Tax=Owenia fusiformis TaxID=6347 RepID=A0A8S4NJ19_OWEFU|nr:unnamed protein product [Owenia fusiformis]